MDFFRCDAEIVIENLFKVFDRDKERKTLMINDK